MHLAKKPLELSLKEISYHDFHLMFDIIKDNRIVSSTSSCKAFTDSQELRNVIAPGPINYHKITNFTLLIIAIPPSKINRTKLWHTSDTFRCIREI